MGLLSKQRCAVAVVILLPLQLLPYSILRAQQSATDAAFQPPATPRFSTSGGAVSTHRFWTAKNWYPLNLTAEGGPYTMFPEPLAVQTTATGLLVGYSPHINVIKTAFLHPVQFDFTIGTPGLRTSKVNIVSSTDRMVKFDFGSVRTTVGRGMPFVYVETNSSNEVSIHFASPPVVFGQQGSRLGVSLGENHYGLFCPSHGSWSHDEKVFVCHLPVGHHYLSVAVMPREADLETFSKYAFAFPVATPMSWVYDREKSTVSTKFDVTTDVREGADPGFLQALYPHQYTSMSAGASISSQTYASARGPMRLWMEPSFTTTDKFHGVLPFLPLPPDFDKATGKALLAKVVDESNSFAAPDTYGQGKAFGRLAQLLPLTVMNGEPGMRDQLAGKMRKQFSAWATPSQGSSRHFSYDEPWGTWIGYPASYGSNSQLNDHHFHYGYWIHAAAMLGLFDGKWITSQQNRVFFGEMVRDIANLNDKDGRYPTLRHFDAYAGHSWASGQAPFADGQNEESTSEAINAWAGLILYATEMNDTKLRDAAIWMYTLETNAARDYWFNDGPVSTFPAGFDRVQVSNVFDGKADAATWFGDAPEFEHGIQFLPFTGASLYLGRNPSYVRRNLFEVTRANGGRIQTTTDKWPDLMEMYQGFYDPAAALAALRTTKYVFDGETRAHEFAWLSSMQSLGRVDDTVSADCVFYAVFRTEAGARTHIAFNPGSTPLSVTFSDGVKLDVPPNAMNVNRRIIPLS